MYQQTEIQSIVEKVIKDMKPLDSKINARSTKYQKKVDPKDIPEYWKGYNKALKNMQAIKVHAEIGEFPEELFAVRAPNQTDAEAAYIRANYKQKTLPVFMDYISTMTRPFFDGNWSINYQQDRWKDSYVKAGEDLQSYVEGEITPVGDLENFIKMVIAQTKAIDANGVVAIRPKTIPTTIVYGEDDQPMVEVDNTELFEPIPIYYSTEQKMDFVRNKYYLIHTDEKSNVYYAGKEMKIGHVFEFYDDTNIWRIIQIGNFVDYKFDYQLFYAHEWDRVPVAEMMGVPQMLDSQNMIWISPFHYAVPNLNTALVSEQYLNASKDKTMFPYLVMIGRPCDFEYENEDGQKSSCEDGHVYNTATGKNMTCPGCLGTGQKDRVSPFGVLLMNPGDEFNKGDAAAGRQAMYYVSPDPAALEFVREGIELDIEGAKKILHQQTSNSIVKGTENLTATGMSLDTKAMFAFVKTPSDQMFYLWEFILDATGWMRYGNDYVKAILIKPVSFDYNTDQDYLYQIGEAQKAGLPPFVIHSIIFRYLQTLYYNEKDRAIVFSLIINTDRLLTLSQDDIKMKFRMGLCYDWETILHDSSINLISELMAADEKFIEMDFLDQQKLLIEKSKARVPVQQTPSQSAVQNALGAGVNTSAATALPVGG